MEGHVPRAFLAAGQLEKVGYSLMDLPVSDSGRLFGEDNNFMI
jgi:hypothetical protein